MNQKLFIDLILHPKFCHHLHKRRYFEECVSPQWRPASVWFPHSSKYLPLRSTEDRSSSRFGMTFGWTIHLKHVHTESDLRWQCIQNSVGMLFRSNLRNITVSNSLNCESWLCCCFCCSFHTLTWVESPWVSSSWDSCGCSASRLVKTWPTTASDQWPGRTSVPTAATRERYTSRVPTMKSSATRPAPTSKPSSTAAL